MLRLLEFDEIIEVLRSNNVVEARKIAKLRLVIINVEQHLEFDGVGNNFVATVEIGNFLGID